MAFIGGSHSWREHDHLVGHRKGIGKILVAPLMQAGGNAAAIGTIASKNEQYANSDGMDSLS